MLVLFPAVRADNYDVRVTRKKNIMFVIIKDVDQLTSLHQPPAAQIKAILI